MANGFFKLIEMKKSKFDKQLERIIKTPEELKLLKKSAKITDSCIPIIKRELRKPNITEKQLARAIDRNIRKQGAQLAFPTIVTCGKRGVFIHAKPTAKKIRGLGYTDFGAKYKGYCTDITVPFVKGEITKEEKKILDITLSVYKKLVKSARVGRHCWKTHDEFAKYVKKRGYKVRHAIGHGIGRDIHEMPLIAVPKRDKKIGPRKRKIWKRIRQMKFETGMVFTIEPGAYVSGVGGCRFENDFVMTRSGAKRLTNSRPITIKT